ncbi:hypothetical protein SAY86_026106 [Trapa natans]|uniref:Uncharacterized protein n=1 Tax=Trapa natans TaxID=22666 RepID=A0AAN7QE80_TRANT|nr:hypothetical protein SAY86_026106 [Trapa natans]
MVTPFSSLVVKKVKFQLKSAEERWAVRFMNFITGANQLLFDGLTRELPLIGFIQGAWMVGVLDQIQIPVSEPDRPPILIDTKTRVRNEYELQKDHSLLGEHLFEYDLEFVEGQIKTSLEFWLGGREATYTPKEERWKCRSCQFALMRPVITGNNKGCSSF